MALWRWDIPSWSACWTPIKINQAEVNKIAILTTLFPGDKEKDRKIIGLFKIGEVEHTDQTYVYADNRHRVRLPLEEAKELNFWDYYSVSGEKPIWGTHLFRYLKDESVALILTDLKDTVRDEKTRIVVHNLLEANFSDIDVPRTTRHRKSRTSTVFALRKYGRGGEGQKHKQLKEWIAQHPEQIGITNVKKTTIEYSFCCGDTVDILFELEDDNDIVVEIETIDPMPGCHQAIKYRALRCAQRGIPLDSKQVKAYLVAWETPEVVTSFCERYSITCKRLKLDG